MSVTVDQVLEEALCLTDESRIVLAERLLESVPPDRDILEAQLAVASRRAHELESGKVEGVPGAEAVSRVRESILKRSQS